MRLVLASASPARLATLRAAGLDPEVIVSGVDEDAIYADSTCPSWCSRWPAPRRAPSRARSATHGDAPVTPWSSGAIRCWNCDGRALGKPGDAAEATSRWLAMRGRTGILHTGHCVLRLADGQVVGAAAETASTTVAFAEVSDAEIAAYVGTGEPLAVAGAFTVDGLGGWFVESIEGDHHNVVGLSLPLLRRLLRQLGLGLSDIGYPRALTGGVGELARERRRAGRAAHLLPARGRRRRAGRAARPRPGVRRDDVDARRWPNCPSAGLRVIAPDLLGHGRVGQAGRGLQPGQLRRRA